MAFLAGFFYSVAMVLLSLPLIKVYQLENYKPLKFVSRVFKFNLAFGDKNKLVLTNRIKRYIFCEFLLFFVVFSLIFYFLTIYYLNLIVMFVGIIFLPVLMIITHYLILPAEKLM